MQSQERDPNNELRGAEGWDDVKKIWLSGVCAHTWDDMEKIWHHSFQEKPRKGKYGEEYDDEKMTDEDDRGNDDGRCDDNWRDSIFYSGLEDPPYMVTSLLPFVTLLQMSPQGNQGRFGRQREIS